MEEENKWNGSDYGHQIHIFRYTLLFADDQLILKRKTQKIYTLRSESSTFLDNYKQQIQQALDSHFLRVYIV